MKRYIDPWGFLQEDWVEKSYDDALWRTAILDIIEDTCSTDECYDKGTVYRHPLKKPVRIGDPLEWRSKVRNTCSRDQVIMDQAARKITNHELPKVKIKFSDKFFQTPDMWLWMRAIRGSKIAEWLFLKWTVFSLPRLLKRNERLWEKGDEHYWKEGIRGRYPFYAFHLMSWMTYVLPDSKMKRKVNRECLAWIDHLDPYNYLLFMLHGGEDSNMLYHINNYLPQTDFRWQRIEDRMPPGSALELYKGPYPIDKDILKAIYERDSPDCVH